MACNSDAATWKGPTPHLADQRRLPAALMFAKVYLNGGSCTKDGQNHVLHTLIAPTDSLRARCHSRRCHTNATQQAAGARAALSCMARDSDWKETGFRDTPPPRLDAGRAPRVGNTILVRASRTKHHRAFHRKAGGRSFEQVADIDKANRAQQFIVPCARFGHLHPDGKASWPSVGTPKCDFRLRVEWFRFVWGGEGFHLCKVVNHSPKRSLHHARILPCDTMVHSPTNRHQGQPMPL